MGFVYPGRQMPHGRGKRAEDKALLISFSFGRKSKKPAVWAVSHRCQEHCTCLGQLWARAREPLKTTRFLEAMAASCRAFSEGHCVTHWSCGLGARAA